MLLKSISSLLLIGSLLMAVEPIPPAFISSGISEKLGMSADTSVQLYNSSGSLVKVKDYLEKGPVLLNFAYYSCPKLCHLVVNGMLDTLLRSSEKVVERLQILTISFDHRDSLKTTQLFKARYYSKLKEKFGDAIQWEFLYGDKASVRTLADSVGFGYQYQPKTNEYSHASALVFLSPQAKISRYLYGIMYNPFDFKLSVLEAARNKTLSTVDSMLLFCYNYDPDARGYVVQAINLMKIAGLVTVFSLALFLGILKKRNG